MLAPLGATVAVVVLFIVVAMLPLPFTTGLPVVVVAFCGKQAADCTSDVVVTLVPLPVGPIEAPIGAGVTSVSLVPPMACTGKADPADINISNIKRIGKAIVAMKLSYILDLIAFVLLAYYYQCPCHNASSDEDCASTNLT